MPIANQMTKMVEGMEMVKKMFEEGARLKAEHGPDNVFDFSIGNPDVPPPAEFKNVIKELVSDESLGHGYTPNTGYPHVRQAVADYLSSLHDVKIAPDLVIMTVGAAGGLSANGSFSPSSEQPSTATANIDSSHSGPAGAPGRPLPRSLSPPWRRRGLRAQRALRPGRRAGRGDGRVRAGAGPPGMGGARGSRAASRRTADPPPNQCT